jgi:hypothetical protein
MTVHDKVAERDYQAPYARGPALLKRSMKHNAMAPLLREVIAACVYLKPLRAVWLFFFVALCMVRL